MSKTSDAVGAGPVRLWRSEAAPYREKLGRYLFQILNRVQSSTLCPSRLRRSLLQVLGMDIGRHCWIARRVHFTTNRVKLGYDVGINMYSYLDAAALIEIGDHTRLGPYVKILTGTHPMERSVIRRKGDLLIGKSVTIERGCWLHIGCTVLPGVRIREGCVIAAGAVVTKDTEPNGWYAGIPATRVKDLPTEEVKVSTAAVVMETREALAA